MRKLCLLLLPLLFFSSACEISSLPGVVTITPVSSAPNLATLTPPGAVAPLPTFTLGPTQALADTPTPTETITPTPAPVARPQYSLDATMDYDTKFMKVSEEISYPNTSADSLSDIILAVEPNLYGSVFELGSLSVNGQAVSSYTLDGQQLDVTLPAPLAAGDTLKLSLAFTLNLPDIVQGDPNIVRPQIFGVTDRQVNLVDWYPFVVPYQSGSGWVLHKPWFYGENLVYPLADFDVTLRFSNSDNLPVVAASAAPEVINGGTRYHLDHARDFSISMGRQFQVLSQTVGDVTVYSYYLGDANKVAGQAVLDATVKAVQTYSQLFGPYPHAALSAVQGDFNDGMEFDGLYFLSNPFYNLYDDTEKNYLVIVAAHETAHQWWFGRVGSDQAQEPWLDEAMAVYCERLFYEKNYPDDVKWWWSYRIDYYQPEGKIDQSVQSYGGFTPYTNAVYRVGAHFFEDLRTLMGDDAFFAFLQDYSAQMNGQIATSADFFRILKTHTNADLGGLLAKYFANPH